MNKASKITIIVLAVLVVLVSATSMTVSVWSTVSDISPRQLVRDIFRLNQPAGYDGKNLLDASSAREVAGNMYIYDAITLEPKTDYVLMPHAETLEAYGEGGMLVLIFSQAELADEDVESLDMLIFSEDADAPDVKAITLYLLPFKFAFSTSAYPYTHLTVISGFDLSAEDTPLKLKIERGIEPTVWTSYGVGTTELYTPTPTAPTDEDPAPTPLAVGDQISSLYVNNTAAGDAILRSLENIDEATCLLLSPSTSTSSGGKTIILADIEDVRILVAVWGDDGAQSFVLLWCSEAGADLSAVGLGVVTTAGWQQAANGDLAQSLGVTGYYVYANGNPQIEYGAWGDGSAELGQANFDALFSSTPFPGAA